MLAKMHGAFPARSEKTERRTLSAVRHDSDRFTLKCFPQNVHDQTKDLSYVSPFP